MILACGPASRISISLKLRSTARLKACRLNSKSPAANCQRMSSSVFMRRNSWTITEGVVRHNTSGENRSPFDKLTMKKPGGCWGRAPVIDGYQANGFSLMINGIDHPKFSTSILPEPFQFSAEWFAAGRIGCDRADGRFDRLCKIGME